ncbi:MAG: polysaccharide deacetylase family protein [Halobacteriota archaeon]
MDWQEHIVRTLIGCQTTEKIAALTFDDGPNPDFTPQILEILAQHRVKATFFLLGQNVAAYPDLARTIVQEGHAIGNHTLTHPQLVGCSSRFVARELSGCKRAIREATGTVSRIMRPPFGDLDLTAFLTARMLGYTIVNWSTSGEDWKGDLAQVVGERVLEGFQKGGIILLHDGHPQQYGQSEWQPRYGQVRDRTPTVHCLPIIISSLASQGYEFITINQMIRRGRLIQIGRPSRRA